MKILAIIGSPRKGNSYKITQQVEQEMKKLGSDVEFEYIFLNDVDLKMCKGCFLCLSKGEDFCPLKDDRDVIIQKMLNSDGVIFVSPVYVMNVTGLMKNFVDRLAFICHRPAFFNQHAMAIATTGALGLKEVTNYLSLAATVWMFRSVVKLGLQTQPYQQNALYLNDKVDPKVIKTAKEFYENIKYNKHQSPDMQRLIQFRIQRAIFTLPEYQKQSFSEADYKYYKDKMNQKFYIDVPVNMFKNLIAGIIEKMVLKQVKKGFAEINNFNNSEKTFQ